MSYCPKCGNPIDYAMAFCPHCGTSLKGAPTPDQVPPTPLCRDKTSEKLNETEEKHVDPEKGEKQEKSEYGFLGYLMGGLILITIGTFSLIDLTTPSINSGQDLAAMLLIIGIIIIIGAVYIATRQMDILGIFKRFISKLLK